MCNQSCDHGLQHSLPKSAHLEEWIHTYDCGICLTLVKFNDPDLLNDLHKNVWSGHAGTSIYDHNNV